MTNNQGNILVVDDTPDNLRLLGGMLSEIGYKVRKALNGKTALTTINQALPDLILLDIMMPEMDGYQVCEKLKSDPKTQEIPVIFISALDDVWDKVKAFQIGGIDYITKPFQEAEVLARIENQLTISRQKKELKKQNKLLEKEIKERQKAEETLRVYLHAVSHDLRNPVIGMSMVLKNLLKGNEKQEKIPISFSVLERMQSSCDRQLNLINSLVETQQLEVWGVQLQYQTIKLDNLTQKLAEEWQPILIKNKATLENKISADLPKVNADPNQLWRVFENIIANSLKHNPPGVKITLSAEMPNKNNMICCYIADNGIGINPEQADSLFELYRRGKTAKRTTGLGLGLYLCRQIIKAHGGEIGVITNPNSGANFWFTLPIYH